jgi:hypothetical protein
MIDQAIEFVQYPKKNDVISYKVLGTTKFRRKQSTRYYMLPPKLKKCNLKSGFLMTKKLIKPSNQIYFL